MNTWERGKGLKKQDVRFYWETKWLWGICKRIKFRICLFHGAERIIDMYG